MLTEEAVHYREWMETMKKNEIGTSSTEYIFELKKAIFKSSSAYTV